jgi:tRNA G18 (ribose-2'-O)-methylase SpoU
MVSSPVDPIADPRDARIASYREVRDGRVRRAGLFLAEGRLVVRRLLESRFTVRSVLATRAGLDDLGEALGKRPWVPRYEASPKTIQAVVGFKFHRGCLALGEEGAPTPARAIIEPPGSRLVVGLEDVVDPDNVGAVFRNAVAFGAAGVLFSPGCADPLYRKAIRVSMGATLAIPFATIDWREGLAALRAAGYTRVALTPHLGAQRLDAIVAAGLPSRRLAVLLGSEGAGLSEATRQSADLAVRIAMAPGVDSLNVATACAIALHRLADAARPGAVRSMMDGDPS